jgi:hypothetical protein
VDGAAGHHREELFLLGDGEPAWSTEKTPVAANPWGAPAGAMIDDYLV